MRRTVYVPEPVVLGGTLTHPPNTGVSCYAGRDAAQSQFGRVWLFSTRGRMHDGTGAPDEVRGLGCGETPVPAARARDRRQGQAVALLLVAVVALGCDRAWNAANRGAATRDVKALLAPHAADVAPDCHMAGVSRNVECEFAATAEDVGHLVAGLGLRSLDASALDRLGATPAAASGCVETFRRRPTVRRYGIAGRPPQLGLARGGAFEFLLLYHDVGDSRACVQLSYAYG